jgi:hypothetical protein
MNRKLQHTAKALSASAAVFTLLLLAGGPVHVPSVAASTSLASQDSSVNLAEPSAAAESSPASQRRRQRHSRALLALPYFSFAQGLRRTRS